MNSKAHIKSAIDGSVATITLNRPEVHNAINFEMWNEIQRVVSSLSMNEEVRVVLFRGAGGKAFSSGADIKDFPDHRSTKARAKIYAEAFESALGAIQSMRQPTISMIQGICAGGGCELAMATDIRIAGTNSVFSIPVAKIGVLLGYKEMKRLIQLVGPSNAGYLLLTANQINETQALSIGLVNEVVSSDSLAEHVYGLAILMSEYSPLAQSGNKRILGTVLHDPNLDALTEEEQNFPLAMFDTSDSKEGYEAFIEKRKPKFTGH